MIAVLLSGANSLTVDLGAAGTGVLDGALSGGGLPLFGDTDGVRSLSAAEDAALTVTLNLSGDSQVQEVVDLAGQLAGSGIDLIGINGAASGTLHLSDTQATALIDAGLSFSGEDTAILSASNAEGTHLSTSLKELQKLGVDAVLLSGANSLTVDLGASGTGVLDGALSGGGLPLFGDTDGVRSLSAAEDAALTVTLNLSGDSQVQEVVDLAGQLAGSGIDLIGINGAASGTLHLNDTQATALIDAGLSFSGEDTAILSASNAEGTHLSTSLKELQKLGVDAVLLSGANSLTVDLGASGTGVLDGALSGGGLPLFGDTDGVRSLSAAEDAALTVTLNLSGDSQVQEVVDLAGQLAGSGIDLIGINGAASGTLHLSDTQATALIDAGLSFSGEDTAILSASNAEGTHLSTSLKELQKLGVDAVLLSGANSLTVDLGASGTGVLDGALSGGGLPLFGDTDGVRSLSAAEDAALTVTLNLSGDSQVQEVVDLAGQLAGSGIDLIGINGAASGTLHLSDTQATALIDAGLSFSGEDTAILSASNAEGTHLSTSLKELQKLGVDAVLLSGANSLTVDLGASGTGVLNGALSGGGLPLFGDTSGDGQLSAAEDAALTVTLNLSGDSQLAEVSSLAGQLHDSRIDLISIPEALSATGAEWIDLSLLDSINANSGLDFRLNLSASTKSGVWTDLGASLHGLDALAGYTDPSQYGSLIKALTDSGVTQLYVDSGNVDVQDELAKALVDAGMLHALPDANIKLDALSSGDYLYTTLADMAKLGVDHVDTITGVDRVYVDLGLPVDQPDVLAEVKGLLNSLDPLNQTKLFTNDGVVKALVMDQNLANSMQVGGNFDAEILKDLTDVGFSEIDVLNSVSTTVSAYKLVVDPSGNVTAQLETAVGDGNHADLYDYLNNTHKVV